MYEKFYNFNRHGIKSIAARQTTTLATIVTIARYIIIKTPSEIYTGFIQWLPNQIDCLSMELEVLPRFVSANNKFEERILAIFQGSLSLFWHRVRKLQLFNVYRHLKTRKPTLFKGIISH